MLTIALPREDFTVVANLPFDKTTAILHKLFDDPASRLVRADLVVEWGVATQLGLPWPSRVKSIVWGSTYEIVVTRRLPRVAFDPAPRVDAGVVSFRRRPAPFVPLDAHERFHRFVASGLQARTAHASRRRGRSSSLRDVERNRARPRRASVGAALPPRLADADDQLTTRYTWNTSAYSRFTLMPCVRATLQT